MTLLRDRKSRHCEERSDETTRFISKDVIARHSRSNPFYDNFNLPYFINLFNEMPIKNLMKTIVIFYSEDSKYAAEKVFGGKSALELTSEWASSLNLTSYTVKSSTLSDLLTDMKKLCDENQADTVLFSYNDLPYLNKELSQKILDSHIEYKSEYTFADGYPYGFAPEALNAGTIGILAELSKTSQKALGDAPVSRDSIYNLIKTDINSFDVETIIADSDWRLLRLAFHCGKKDNFMQCKALFEATGGDTAVFADVEKLSELASKNPACLKTVPGFYNIQISDKANYESIYLPEHNYSQNTISYEKCAALVDQIAEFSEKAVISLSAFGEPLFQPEFLKIVEKALSYKGLSVFFETDGLAVSPDFAEKLAQIEKSASPRTNGWQKIMVAVILDAASEQTYQKIHKNSPAGAFQTAVNSVALLQTALPGSVYPQFVRMNENEAELEAFYRYWNEKSNPSGGNLIIQKYDDFAGQLPPCKPADLSPLERDPCWHLRRDMTILYNGDVPACRTCWNQNITGNVFNQSLEEIWHKTDLLLENHINKNYCCNGQSGKCANCEKCDEWYTFNF